MSEHLRDMLRRAAPDELAATLEVALSDDADPAVRRDAALTIASALIAVHRPDALPELRRLLDDDDDAPTAQPDPGADVPLCFYEDRDQRRHLLL